MAKSGLVLVSPLVKLIIPFLKNLPNVYTYQTIPGLDTTYALLKYLYGPEPLDTMMNVIEYAPHTNPSWDPYAVVYNVSLFVYL